MYFLTINGNAVRIDPLVINDVSAKNRNPRRSQDGGQHEEEPWIHRAVRVNLKDITEVDAVVIASLSKRDYGSLN